METICRRNLRFVFLPAILLSSATCLAQTYDPAQTETYRLDHIGRVVAVDNKTIISCPKQTTKTAVLLIAGQSNAGNHAKARFKTAYPSRAANFFNGSCYAAGSPLLGTTGIDGESWTLLADSLIKEGSFDQVVIVPAAIGGTEIERWREGGDLNRMLLDVVELLQKTYTVTHVLWHQGEGDYFLNTTASDYIAGFKSLVHSLRAANVSAPIYVSVASKTRLSLHFGDSWSEDDPVTIAQKSVVAPSQGIYAGPNTNLLVPDSERYDGSHFGEAGQTKFAAEWVRLLRTKP